MHLPPAVKIGRDVITQGLTWGAYTSPAVIKPEAVRPFALKDALAPPGDKFCLWNRACNFLSRWLSPSVSVPGHRWQWPASLVTASTAKPCEIGDHCQMWAKKPPNWLFSCRLEGVQESKPGETLRNLCVWKGKKKKKKWRNIVNLKETSKQNKNHTNNKTKSKPNKPTNDLPFNVRTASV